MKKITLLIAFTAFTIGLYAQSLTLSYPGGIINNGDTVTFCTVDLNTPILAGEKLIFVHNTGTALAEVTCKKEVIDTIQGTKNKFCWGQCYSDTIYEPSTKKYIEAGDSTVEDGFSGEYEPNGHAGATYMRYYFTNTVNHDQITVVIKYNAGPDYVNNYTQNPNRLNVFPNPASNQVNVDYTFSNCNNNTIIVKNLIGATVYTSEAVSSTGKISISTSDFTDGIYFVTFLSNNFPQSTKKLIVKH
jgi:hypothetical protein